MDNKKTPQDFLKEPYEHVLVREADGSYSASITEFEGCLACGDTTEEALKNLEEVALSWIEAELEQGRTIPPPWASQELSGRFALRIARSLHQSLFKGAQHEGISLNQYIGYVLSRGIGEMEGRDYVIESLNQKVEGLTKTISLLSAVPPYRPISHIQAISSHTLGWGTTIQDVATTDISSIGCNVIYDFDHFNRGVLIVGDDEIARQKSVGL